MSRAGREDGTILEWISVKDELPELFKNVLGVVEYDFDGKHYKHHRIVYHAGSGRWEPLSRQSDKITYWMPLPDIPEE